MQILVLSDSHGHGELIDRVIRKYSDIKHIFFLGDTVRDIEDFVYEYPDKKLQIVSGNCDFINGYPSYDIVRLEDTDILYCHGHGFDVKSSLTRLVEFSENVGAKLSLYGHTHIPSVEFINGITLVNPGSIARGRNSKNTFAIVDVTKKGIVPQILEL